MVKIDKADSLFSKYVRTKANWTCQRCLTKYPPPTSALHCSHFIGRAKENTRFEESNATALCMGCHLYFTSHPMEHYDWQVLRLGQAEVDRLKLMSHLYKKKDRKSEALYWAQRLKELA